MQASHRISDRVKTVNGSLSIDQLLGDSGLQGLTGATRNKYLIHDRRTNAFDESQGAQQNFLPITLSNGPALLAMKRINRYVVNILLHLELAQNHDLPDWHALCIQCGSGKFQR